MASSILDNPLFLSIAFHPRKTGFGLSNLPNSAFKDGTFVVDGQTNIMIGYRLYFSPNISEDTPCMIYFHGNAELATDCDAFYHQNFFSHLCCNMISIDFRGYGWSTSNPTFSTLLSDVETIFPQITNVLIENNMSNSMIFSWGRSIGSACAVHLAYKFPKQINGLIIESGLSNLTSLPMVQQLSKVIPGGDSILALIPDVFEQIQKMKSITNPVLILHGDEDEIIPINQAYELSYASVSIMKRLHIFSNCGHNNIRACLPIDWLVQVDDFLNSILSRTSRIPDTMLASYRNKKKNESSLQSGVSKNSRLNALLSKAEEYLLEKRFKEAISVFTQVSREDKGDEHEMLERVCRGRALAYVQIQRWVDACDDCNTLLAVDPADTQALSLRMKCHCRLGNWKAAGVDGGNLFKLLTGSKASSDAEVVVLINMCALL